MLKKVYKFVVYLVVSIIVGLKSLEIVQDVL